MTLTDDYAALRRENWNMTSSYGFSPIYIEAQGSFLMQRGGLAIIVKRDIETLAKKDISYAGSWKKRGGVGAFMMLARKWDRIEAILSSSPKKYDILDLPPEHLTGDDSSLLAEIRDLRCYLLLVEEELMILKYASSKKASADLADFRRQTSGSPPPPVTEDDYQPSASSIVVANQHLPEAVGAEALPISSPLCSVCGCKLIHAGRCPACGLLPKAADTQVISSIHDTSPEDRVKQAEKLTRELFEKLKALNVDMMENSRPDDAWQWIRGVEDLRFFPHEDNRR